MCNSNYLNSPRPKEFSDKGNAEAFAEVLRNSLFAYSPIHGWIRCRGDDVYLTTDVEINIYALEFVEFMKSEAYSQFANDQNNPDVKAYAFHVRRTRSRVQAFIDLSKSILFTECRYVETTSVDLLAYKMLARYAPLMDGEDAARNGLRVDTLLELLDTLPYTDKDANELRWQVEDIAAVASKAFQYHYSV